MTDKQRYFLERVKEVHRIMGELAAELKEDNPYNHTQNSILEWTLKCFDTLEFHLSKKAPQGRPCELDYDHTGE
jgi:hypothetical protein